MANCTLYNNLVYLSKKHKKSFHKIECELGFGNAVLRGWTHYTYGEKIKKVADYFGVPVEDFICKDLEKEEVAK